MEVMLSINFFRPVVPQEYQKTYGMMRQWLIDHDVIKGKKTDGSQSHPKPFGIGYRIPTQGMSSMFAMTVADVLPTQSGDTILYLESLLLRQVLTSMSINCLLRLCLIQMVN